MGILRGTFLLLIGIFSAVPTYVGAAESVYQQPEIFIQESFAPAKPQLQTLVLDAALQKKVRKIMGSHYVLPKVDYWHKEGRTAWILEAIGKYDPITTGLVVGRDGLIERIKVLIYRESHGWEVKHHFFTRQFKGAGLAYEKKLDQSIDGIAGATLSVRALKKLAALALLLHQEVQ